MTVDLAIVGAGPAGMAAALTAAELGLDTLVIDEAAAPGGQVYRAVERARDSSPLGADYLAGRQLASAFRSAKMDYRPASTVWHIGPSASPAALLSLVADGRSEAIAARHIVLATGAVERPVPIRGWTLPGVMTAGAAQILLKSADLVPQGRIVLAGQGPLLILAAVQLARAGAPPAAVLETTAAGNYYAALGHLGAGWSATRELAQGIGWLLELRRTGVPLRRGVRGLRALGRGRLEAVAWDGGEMAAEHLFLHDGVIPNLQISLALQVAHRWDAAQQCWHPVVDAWGRSTLPNTSIAGDGAAIAGAEAAELSGRLAALDAATALGKIDSGERDRRGRAIRTRLDRALAVRPFLDVLYRPSDPILAPVDDDIIVCRCEEVTAGQVRRAVRLGAAGPNQVKAFLRCGMGPCQGRMCAPVVSGVIADERGLPIADIGTFRPRAPYKPMTLGALAGEIAES
ncbi:MAG: NAD(P)/FAD-dependent oxidoreductase [Thiohalocapsa sp.]